MASSQVQAVEEEAAKAEISQGPCARWIAARAEKDDLLKQEEEEVKSLPEVKFVREYEGLPQSTRVDLGEGKLRELHNFTI